MLDYFAWSVAVRNLRSNIGQNLLTMGVVAINVTLIIFLSALIGGLQRRLINNVTGAIPHITVRTPEKTPLALWDLPAFSRPEIAYAGEAIKLQVQERKIEDWQVWMNRLPSYDTSILALSPVIERQGIAVRGSQRMAVAVAGVVPEQHNAVVDIQTKLVRGRFFGLNAGEVAVGYKLAEDFAVRLGDKIRLINSFGQTATYTISGIFDTGFKAVDSSTAFITLRDAQSLFRLGNAVTVIGLKLKDIFAAEELARRLRQQVPYEVTSWMQDNQSLLSGLRAQSQSSNLILIFTTIASGFGIASIMIMAVVSKFREIGILKAMGARRRQIIGIFAIQGILLAILGGIIGTGIGLGLCLFLRGLRMSENTAELFPVEITPQTVVIALAVATLVGFVAALYPAWRASRINAIEVIRGT